MTPATPLMIGCHAEYGTVSDWSLEWSMRIPINQSETFVIFATETRLVLARMLFSQKWPTKFRRGLKHLICV